MARYSISFNGYFDLEQKFEKIKLSHELVNKLYKKHLLDNAIPFTEIGDVGVVIDISKVPENKKQFLGNPFKEIIQTVYDKTGVTNANE